MPSNSDLWVTRRLAGSVASSTAKAVVLSGNHHYIVIDIFNRMVTAVVAEFHLNGLRAARQRQQLMAETDAKDRNIGGEEFFSIAAMA